MTKPRGTKKQERPFTPTTPEHLTTLEAYKNAISIGVSSVSSRWNHAQLLQAARTRVLKAIQFGQIPLGNPDGYVYRIAKNASRSEIRRLQRLHVRPVDATLPSDMAEEIAKRHARNKTEPDDSGLGEGDEIPFKWIYPPPWRLKIGDGYSAPYGTAAKFTADMKRHKLRGFWREESAGRATVRTLSKAEINAWIKSRRTEGRPILTPLEIRRLLIMRRMPWLLDSEIASKLPTLKPKTSKPEPPSSEPATLSRPSRPSTASAGKLLKLSFKARLQKPVVSGGGSVPSRTLVIFPIRSVIAWKYRSTLARQPKECPSYYAMAS